MLPGKSARRQILVLLPSYVNGITSGCIIGWTANAVFLLNLPDAEITASAEELWWIVSMMEIGKMIFSIPAGLLADKVGKENILTNVGLIHFTSWVMLSICTSIPLVCFARFLAGIGTALLNATAMATIGEIASPEIRGTLATLQQTCVLLGNLSQALITAIYPSYSVLAYVATIISSVYFITMYWLIETPSSLIKAEKFNQAKSNLAYLRPDKTQNEIDLEFDQLKTYIEEENFLTRDTSCWQIITTKNTFKPILITASINFFMLLTGVSVVLAYITEIVPYNNIIDRKFYPLIIMSVSVFSSLTTNLFIDRIPRRILFITVAIMIFFTQASNGLMYYFYTAFGVSSCAFIFTFGNLFFRVLWAFLLLPLSSVIRSEIFPQNVKGIGNAFCDMAQAMSITLTFKLYECMNSNNQLTDLYYIFAISAIVMLGIVYFYLPEGRGKSLVEIQKQEIQKMGN
ncbi:facilitated trehalose transporter Tret1-like [Planococcus citri]|uniref:facilitated trehalose transporter Tret1-like n=1 Tax=Planococcus citri TaxID=170843 RepID=UPI0031F87355